MHLFFLIPGDLESRTGGYGYDRRMVRELRGLGWQVVIHRLDGSYPLPTAEARRQTADVLAALPDGGLVLVDGLAFGAMAEEAERERGRLRLVALVHHPLAYETGTPADVARLLEESERRALACARLVFVTSRATVRSLAPYGVPREHLVVVEPGTDPEPLAKGSPSSTMHLLSVASITPRKGYETLMRALARLTDLDWRLTCAGSLARAPDTTRRVREEAARGGIEVRVAFVGELGEDAVARCYDEADLFVLATFHEGYGMAVAEALARGLPVVSTPTGGIPELVGEDGGVLVPAADVDALAGALRRFMTDAPWRERLRAGARLRRQALPSWRASAEVMNRALLGLQPSTFSLQP